MASARQHLPRLLALAAREPQAVYRRDTLVATVVNPKVGAQIKEALARKETNLAADLAELRRLCTEEKYVLQPPRRVDRSPTAPGRARVGAKPGNR